MSHTLTLWERVAKAKLRVEVGSCGQQYVVMPKKDNGECSTGFKGADEEKSKRSEGIALHQYNPYRKALSAGAAGR